MIDNDLIQEFKNGNINAFTKIYNQTSPLVYRCALSIVKNHDDVNDVIQNVYIKVYNKIHTLSDTSKFKTWLLSITYNESKNLLMSRKRYSEYVNTNFDICEDENWINIVDENSDFEEEYIIQETNNNIKNLINNLPSEQKQVLLLYYFEEKNISSIAKIMQCSEGTIKSRLNYSRKNLKKEINNYEEKYHVRLHSGSIITLLNIEHFNNIHKQSVLFKASVLGMTAMCSVTMGLNIINIDKNINDINVITEETTEITTTAPPIMTTEDIVFSEENIEFTQNIEDNNSITTTVYTEIPDFYKNTEVIENTSYQISDTSVTSQELLEDNRHIRKEFDGNKKDNDIIQKELDDNEKDSDIIKKELDDSEKDNDIIKKELDDSEKDNNIIKKELDDNEKDDNIIKKELDDNEKDDNIIKKELDDSEKNLNIN